jgi:hypothetical protein
MAIVANSTPFGRHFGPLQELLDFAITEIPEAALTPEMLEAVTWFNSWDRSADRLRRLMDEPV